MSETDAFLFVNLKERRKEVGGGEQRERSEKDERPQFLGSMFCFLFLSFSFISQAVTILHLPEECKDADLPSSPNNPS